MMKKLLFALIATASTANAQFYDPALPPKPSGVIGTPEGTGKYPAVAEARADMPLYTFYRPAKMPKAKLPLVLWGNGACMDNGLSASHFLREIASHGYFVIAVGRPRAEYPVGPEPRMPAGPPPAVRATKDETQFTQLLDAIDWAVAQKSAAIDTSRIAVMGHSCGGLQTLKVAADPRIKTAVMFNSGVYLRPGVDVRSGVQISKDDLLKLHTPVAYFIGGPTDIAYTNADDDVKRIAHVAVFYGNLPVGHNGTFRTAPNGGEWARVGTAWLDWQLKGKKAASKLFKGKNCTLCTDQRWTIVQKNMAIR